MEQLASNTKTITENISRNTFDERFKYYKQRCPPPDFSSLLDITEKKLLEPFRVQILPCKSTLYHDEDLGLIPFSKWKIFVLESKPGLVIIPNPFTSRGQRLWMSHSLEEFTRKPHRLNLDAHDNLRLKPEEPQWWQACCKNDERGLILKKKLRWSTMGYHHNWDTKVYSEDAQSKFPADLALLAKVIAHAAGFPSFNAEAAIVNFYHLDSTLSGHTDHSEQDHTAPLISISFGQDAVFLVGGTEKKETPLALLLHSGDIVIMSGVCRLSYHGVPRILPSLKQPWTPDVLSEDWEPFEDYISTRRINLNIRQVLPPGKFKLSED